MKNLALGAMFLMTLSANTCLKSSTEANQLRESKWEFVTVNGTAVQLPDGVERPWVQLSDDALAGFGGCNRLMGAYELEGSTMRIPNLASTKMYCENTMATEDAVKRALGSMDSYRMEDGLLHLVGGGNTLATLRNLGKP